MKHFPLPMHPFARKAALAAVSAGKQGKMWEYSQKLFENSAYLNDAKIRDLAQQLGLDMDRFTKDTKDPAVQTIVDIDKSEGERAGVPGTPTLFVNGKLVKNLDVQELFRMIEIEAQKKKK